MKALRENLIITLTALCCLIGASMVVLCYGYYILSALIFILAGVSFYRVLQINKASRKKIDFMFSALENDDYTFNFPEFGDNINELALNSLLNRIKSLLSNAKLRTIEQEKYYEHIFDKLDIGVMIINERGNIMRANQSMYEILGVEILAHTNHIARVSKELSQVVMQCVEGETCEVSVASESGDKAYSVVTSLVTIEDKELKIVAVSSLGNVLDRKEIETWSKLTRVLTHEIMNSLAPITSLSETLKQINSDPKMEQGLAIISKTNKSLISFVENYRSITRIPKPVKSPIDVKPFLENIVQLICPSDVRTAISVEPLDTMIYADENLVHQVVVNILKNGLYAIGALSQKCIEIKAFIRKDESVVIEITNNGAQIADDVVENLFIPFYTTKPDGRGVGLSISKQIMQQHSGNIRLAANQTGRVTFSLIFK
ncbi:MAG: ATP-binding protein [Rikenellaceae bacterium]